MNTSIVHIKFVAQWEDERGTLHRGLTEFKLGLGPCGGNVTKLMMDDGPTNMSVLQVCEDGTVKQFVYAKEDILGRIEITAIEDKQGAVN